MNGIQTFLYEMFIPSIVILCILAVAFNIVVFLSRFYVKTHSASLELTYSLALSDMWTSTVIAISLFWNSYRPVVLGQKPTNYCFSLALEAFRTGGLLTACFHLAALGFVHYLTIIRPFDHVTLMNPCITHVLIIIIWIIPPFALMAYFSCHPGEGFRNEICAGVQFYESLYFRVVVAVIIITLIFVTSFLYWSMLRKISTVRTKTTSASTKGRRTVVTAALIFGTFLVGWMPASIAFVLTAKGMPLYQNQSILVTIVSIVSLIGIMAKTLTNPIIYATRIPEIRQFVLQKILWRLGAQKFDRRSELTPLRPSTMN